MSTALSIPSSEAAEQAQSALKALRALPRTRGPRKLQVAPQHGRSVSITVPREAFEHFLEVLGQLANGHAVTIVPVHAELTTQEAADMLNISRPHLITMLDEGRIPFTKTGTHRRLRAADVMTYKAERDAEHAETLRELTAAAQKLKLGY